MNPEPLQKATSHLPHSGPNGIFSPKKITKNQLVEKLQIQLKEHDDITKQKILVHYAKKSYAHTLMIFENKELRSQLFGDDPDRTIDMLVDIALSNSLSTRYILQILSRSCAQNNLDKNTMKNILSFIAVTHPDSLVPELCKEFQEQVEDRHSTYNMTKGNYS